MSKQFTLTLLLLSLGISSLVGCKPKDQIEVYKVPRTTAPRTPHDAEAAASQLDHILAAIVPQGDKAWFFKLVGPAKAIDRQRDAFREFLATITVDNTSKQPPTWQVPQQWEEKPASEMRAATLLLPDEDGPLEIAVSSLPLTGDWEDYVARNVNRWLGQLGQSTLDEATIAKLVEKVSVEGGEATFVELVGVMAKSPMRGNPHATVMADRQSGEASDEHPPESKHLAFETPEGWLPGRLSAMRKAAFRLADGEAKAEVTVIDLPTSAGSQVSDVEANVKRWAGQVGLTDLDAEALEKLTQPVTIDGSEGTYVELIGPDDVEHPVAMLVAMVVRKEKVWFIKMAGETSLVKSQQEAFRGFLESIKFK